MKFRSVGIINGGNGKPRIIWDWKERRNPETGQMQKVKAPFIHFTMACEDRTKSPSTDRDTGRTRRPRELVQVVLPETKRAEKFFEYLAPGRLIEVEGDLTVDPKAVTDQDGIERCYANMRVYVRNLADIKFMDSPPDRQVDRFCGYMIDSGMEVNGTKITEEIADKLKHHLIGYMSSLQEKNGPPREILDKTKTSKSYSQPTYDESTDPDDPDFANQ